MDIEINKVYKQKTTNIKMKVLKHCGEFMDNQYYVVQNIDSGFKWVESETMFKAEV